MIDGIAALESCDLGGVCPVYCGGPTCSDDFNNCAYPNYFACTGHDCTPISWMPRAGTCNSTVWFTSPCIGGVEWGGSIFDCGPCDGQWSTAGACNNGVNLPFIACVTPALFKRLCDCGDPWLWGIVRISLHV
jgi:hypothetical protein